MLHVFLGYGFAFMTATIVLGGDYLIKLAADGDMPLTSRHMVIGCMLYGISAIAWYFAMRHTTLAQAGVAFSMFSLLALCALGVLFFGEEIRPREGVGIVFALLSMILLMRIA